MKQTLIGIFTLATLGMIYTLFAPHTNLALYLGIFDLTVILLTVPFVLAVRRLPPGVRRPWVLLMWSQIFAAIGTIFYTATYAVDPEFTFPGPSDLFYVIVYGLQIAGLVTLARRRSPKHDFIAWIDATLIALTLFAFIMVFWSAQLEKLLANGWINSISFFVSPAIGVVTVSLLVRLAMSADRKEPSLILLLCGQFSILAADVAHMYNFHLLDEHMDSGLIHFAWLVGYGLMSLAALRPDAKYVGMESHKPVDRTGNMYGWFAFATIIALSVPILGFVLTPSPEFERVFEAANIIVVALVLGRAALLLNIVQKQSSQLADLARSDALTGLPNRRTWDFEIQRAIEHAELTSSDLWIAVLDVDHFKKYNDTLGHAAGDELLAAASKIWRHTLPEHAFISRYGGEEFGVLLPEMTPDDVLATLNKVRLATPDNQTTSIGAARWRHGDTPLEVFRRADLALYEAKRTGRNQVIMHSDSTNSLFEKSVPTPKNPSSTPSTDAAAHR